MRAAQVLTLTGPADVSVVDVETPTTAAPGQVLIRVRAVGVSFPDLLLSKGMYQLKPEPPFTLGVDVAGVVEALGEGVSGFEVGQRVAAVVMHGGAAEVTSAPADWVFPLPDVITFEEGAALPMNYLTAEFVLSTRARVEAGETVVVNGAAGGLGTATIQVAKGLGATVIAVVSSPAKITVARAAGADHVISVTTLRDSVAQLTDGRGADVVVDIVGDAHFTDYLRCLGEFGRLMVVGFAAGTGIPEVKVNRLLLNNIDVRGAAWGAAAMTKPGYMQAQWERLAPMIDSGVVRPLIGQVMELDQFSEALVELDERRATGKVVARVS